ncbi:MAG TPA: menaquinone biosynthesis protein [Candidatus Angelobacter sp.]|jgi:chorismate dehydratase|nr:menaquinone biosynthesis protein [Candidatus Angelobacter sp.]
MSPLRISAISFLNTAPLMWDFEQGDSATRLREHFSVSYTVPALCAEQLKAGEADIGIIPAATYTTIPDLVILPDVAIASKNEVRSILLVSKVPVDKIRSVATDDSSRTSAALVEIFLRKFVGVTPAFVRQKPVLEEMLKWHDAGLLIGDPALLARTEGLYVYDLAEQWRNWTGRPFVFAFWAVRRAALSGAAPDLDLAQVFRESRDHGLQHVSDIVAAWAPKLSLPAPVVRDYLTTNIDYTLDEENLQGLQLFYRYAAELQVLPPAPPLRFLEQPRMASKL